MVTITLCLCLFSFALGVAITATFAASLYDHDPPARRAAK